MFLGQGLFAYALANGTVGVYERSQRLWRVKSKHQATQFGIYDVNEDGTNELVRTSNRILKSDEVILENHHHNNFDFDSAGKLGT